jgi:hypothetical protein
MVKKILNLDMEDPPGPQPRFERRSGHRIWARIPVSQVVEPVARRPLGARNRKTRWTITSGRVKALWMGVSMNNLRVVPLSLEEGA